MTAAVVGGLAVAAAAWWWLFQAVERADFWRRSLVAGAALGTYGVVAAGGSLPLDVGAGDVAVGVGAAVVLYGVFWAGDRFLRRFLPSVAREVGDLYGVRGAAPVPLIAAALVVVGTAEELFWRGFVQDEAGLAVAVVAYSVVHVTTRKAALVLAAAVGGLWWGGLFAWTGSLAGPIVSHVLWDLAVIVWFPFRAETGPK